VQSYLNKTMLLGRPTYLSPDSGFTAILFYLVFFAHCPPTRWTELNQNQPYARK